MARFNARKDRSALLADFFLTWLPLFFSLISFAFSAYTFIVTTREPELEVILPDGIRIAQGENYGYAYLYFQPTLVNAGNSQRVEVIKGMSLLVGPVKGGDPVRFVWREQGKFDYKRGEGYSLSYVYTGDAAPLLVDHNTAQAPVCTFYGPENWYFKEGEYRFTLVVNRAVAKDSVRQEFRVALPKDDVAFLNEQKGEAFMVFRIVPEKQ